jgi:hypothetical protein
MHSNVDCDDDDDDDTFDGGDDDNNNNNFNNFNEAFSYQLIAYPSKAAMQYESVFGLRSFFAFSYHLRYNVIGVSGRSRPRSRGRLHCSAVCCCSSL